MTRRWGRAYDAKYEALVWRQKARGMDGKICEICMRRADVHGKTALVVEHIDNDDKNPALDNLRLSHQSCNVAKDPPNIGPRNVPQVSVCVKKEPAPVATWADGYSAKKNFQAEPAFRRWVFAIMKSNPQGKTYDWLVVNGAAYVGANPVTVGRYLDKMLAEVFGCLSYEKDEVEGQVIKFKELEAYEQPIETLEEWYPWAGAIRSEMFKTVKESETAKAQKATEAED